MKLHILNSSTDNYNRLRCILFLLPDPEANTMVGAPSISDILQDTQFGVGYRSFYKKNSRLKYRILYDKTFTTGGYNSTTLTPNFVGTNLPLVRDATINLKWKKGLPIHYKNEQAGEPIKNQLWFIFISDSIAANHPQISTYSRIHWDP